MVWGATGVERMSTPVSSSCPGGGERPEGIDMDMDIEVEGWVGGPVVTPRVVPVNELVAVTPELTLPHHPRILHRLCSQWSARTTGNGEEGGCLCYPGLERLAEGGHGHFTGCPGCA